MLTDYLHGKGVEMKGSLQTKSGKYYAVFRIDGKQKWINLYVEDKRGNKRKAETAMRELLQKYEQNPFLFEKTDFCEYIKRWLENTKTHVDLVTYNGYKQYAEKHIIPYFEPKRQSMRRTFGRTRGRLIAPHDQTPRDGAQLGFQVRDTRGHYQGQPRRACAVSEHSEVEAEGQLLHR